MKKIYLAGPFFDDQQLKLIQKVEGTLHNNKSVKSFFSPRNGNSDQADDIGSPRWAKATFLEDVNQIQKADVMVAILDYPHANPDSGTAFEIGYAYAHSIPLVLFQAEKDPVNIMLSQGATAYLTSLNELKSYNFDQMPKQPYTGKNF